APKWCTGTIWWSAEPSAQAGNSPHHAEIKRQLLHAAACAWKARKERAGFCPEGRGPPTRRRRQPAWGNAPTHSIASASPEFHSRCRFPQPPTKEDPGAKRGQGLSPDG